MFYFFILPETWRVIIALPEMRLLQLLFKHVLPYIYIYTEMKGRILKYPCTRV